MNIKRELLDIDFLVFSSQKTATQTIMNSLNYSGVKSLHCHVLENIDLQKDQFKIYLETYQNTNARELHIISVFRDPMERMISSFFQSLSEEINAYTDPYNTEEIHNQDENVIYKLSWQELQTMFCDYTKLIDGWGESVIHICDELDVSVDDLEFDDDELIGVNDLHGCRLYLLRFDLMLPKLAVLLTRIAGRNIVVQSTNMNDSKYYAEYHEQFKNSLKVPPNVIKLVYDSRKKLMDLFYPDQFNSILTAKIHQYGL